MAVGKTTASGGGIGSKSVFWMILASGAGVFVLIAILMSFTGDHGGVKTDQTEQAEVAQEPTGAGTNPDGVADEAEEGLANTTSTDDFIESSAAASAEVTEEGDTSPEPETSAANVEPAAEGSDNVDQMTATSEMNGTDTSSDEETASNGIEDGDAQMATPEDQAMNDDAATEGEDTAAVTEPEIVEDPDNGYNGEDPDGGAAAFMPTPSGPEGRDDDPYTTE